MFEELEFRLSMGSDNHSGVHPRVMAALVDANRGHAHAYGLDELCKLAEREFTRVFGDGTEAHYVFTGTAANVLSFAPLLRSHEAILCSSVAHLHQDECAAPEKFIGCKLWTLPSVDGRIKPEDAHATLERMGDQHFAQPRAVSLTQPTELGVTYTLGELRAWRRFTRERNLMLHLDGARLANAAAHLGCGLKELTGDLGVDLVSVGGTKNGLMGAEAIVLCTPEARAGLKFQRKQAMQLSSKTRFLAAQFYAYLKDDLWLEIAKHVTTEARALAKMLKEFPEIEIAFPVESNALFVRLPRTWLKPLRDEIFFYVWDSTEEQRLCRWMISFDWKREWSDRLVKKIREVRECHPAR